MLFVSRVGARIAEATLGPSDHDAIVFLSGWFALSRILAFCTCSKLFTFSRAGGENRLKSLSVLSNILDKSLGSDLSIATSQRQAMFF
jgi:hypothetical protein